MKKRKKNNTGDSIFKNNSDWSFGGNVFKNFEKHIDKSVPLYRKTHELYLNFSDFFLQSNSTILDIGCSTGNFLNSVYKRHYLKDSFDFSIESVGVFKESKIIFKACNIINFGLMKIKQNEEQKNYTLKKNNIALENSVDITLQNVDYTLGKLLEFIIYKEYYTEQKVLSFCGFLKPHPHEDYSIISPIILESGQIERDLKVGDKKITNAKIKR